MALSWLLRRAWLPPSFCVAGVALGDIDLHFVWQAWHLATWTFTLCGRRATYGTQLAPVTRLVAADAASFCVAGVALGDIDLHFVWQALHLVTWTFAWRLATSTSSLCGRCGTYGIQLAPVMRLVAVDAASLCVAHVAFGDIDLHFVWQAWPLVTWTFTLCGRRGTYGIQLAPVTRLVAVDTASLCVAGVAFGDMGFHFVWQAWRLATWAFTLCGRRGTYGIQLAPVPCLVAVDAASLCVAGVAFGDMGLHFVWQAWRLATWTFTLCGKRGTYGIQLAPVTRLVAVHHFEGCLADRTMPGLLKAVLEQQGRPHFDFAPQSAEPKKAREPLDLLFCNENLMLLRRSCPSSSGFCRVLHDMTRSIERTTCTFRDLLDDANGGRSEFPCESRHFSRLKVDADLKGVFEN
eukprot:s1622_g14.t1